MSDRELAELLAQPRTIAVVGLSPKPIRASHAVAGYLQSRGHRIIPVNPNAVGQEILGEPAVASLGDIAVPVDIVDVFRRSELVPPVARDARALRPRVFWMQSGIRNPEAAALLQAAGVAVVEDRCLAVEMSRLVPRARAEASGGGE